MTKLKNSRNTTTILPVFWNATSGLNTDFAMGLDIFYSRLPFLESGEPPEVTGSDIDSLLEEASKHKEFKWAAVFGLGTLFASQLQIVSEIETFIQHLPEEVLVCGHLINKKGFYCGIHEQFFLVNLEIYRRLDRPQFGGYGKSRLKLQNYTCGESIHDDYTPRWIRPLKDRSEHQTKCCGWNFVDRSLSAGLPIFNLSDSLRKAKVYLYPGDETDKLNHNLRLLLSMEDLDNISQRIALAHLLLKKLRLYPNIDGTLGFVESANCLFFFNTETLLPQNSFNPSALGPLDVYSGPCSGFQDLAFLHRYGFHAKTELIYFDINPKAVGMKRYMLENFDGQIENLPLLFKKIQSLYSGVEIYGGDLDLKIRELLEIFDNDPVLFRNVWLRLRELKRKFLNLNLVNQSKTLFDNLNTQQSILLNLTDIFLGQNELLYSRETSLQKLIALHDFTNKYPRLTLTGTSLNNRRFIDFAKNLDPKSI